jgi:prolyl-tRNA editing enzyme YbaK/EbsC (Cys-tRNA(Pro) deacylase)
VRAGAFEVLVDASAARWAQVHVSAGVRGVDLELAVDDLLAATGGRLAEVARRDAGAHANGEEDAE